MAINLSHSKTLESIELVDGEGTTTCFLASGSNGPEVDFPDAPIGVFYFRSNGQVFRKLDDTGIGVFSDWSEGTGGSGVSTQNLPFFRSNGSQDDILLINGSIPFFRSNGTQDNIAVI